MWYDIVVSSRITGCGNEQGIISCGDGVVEGLRITAATPAIVCDPHAHHGGVFHGTDRIECAARSVVAKELERHQLGTPVHAYHALAVVAGCGDCPGDMGAVRVHVHRIAVIVGEVVSVDIVDVSVAVVINVVAGDLSRVGPDVRDQIGVRVVDTGVDYTHHDAATGLDVPGFNRIDIGIVGSTALSRIMQSPELTELRVVGSGRIDGDCVVRLNVLEARIVTPLCNRIFNITFD